MNTVKLEPIRLVVWDLDETFWRGTLSEGGIKSFIPRHCEIVMELARRGIISSICSKNDHGQVEAILREQKIWDYFVLPSINWMPKAPRVKSLIDEIGLRAATVLFIDDNHGNRAEVSSLIPDIRVETEECISSLLDHPVCKGKVDEEFTRLKQYKQLETRKRLIADSHLNPTDFLRESGITVSILHEIEPHMERVIELINRTNQLNFTKRRLPEEPVAAKRELSQLIARYDVQCGLIRVWDNYGDYGFVGFYALQTFGQDHELLHFCFSCRTLGLDVEKWVYQRIGAPPIKIVGEVLSKLDAAEVAPDWISFALPQNDKSAAAQLRLESKIILRGGCSLAPLAHYFNLVSSSVTSEFNMARAGLSIRRDHSVFLRYGLNGLTEAKEHELLAMGFQPDDFESALFESQPEGSIWILSFWADADFALYRHKSIGVELPLDIYYPGVPEDLTSVSIESLPLATRSSPRVVEVLGRLRAQYEWVGLISQEDFGRNVRALLDRCPRHCRVFVLGQNEVNFHASLGRRNMWWKANAYTRAIVAAYANVEWIDINSFLLSSADVESDPNHFHRSVYHRVFQYIFDRCMNGPAAQAKAQ